MEGQILNLIKQYETVIIYRHKNPDLDAIGSQMGLYHALKENFQNKRIYAVGDLNDYSNLYNITMDEIADEAYKNSLVIILDVAVSNLITDDRYLLADKIVIIDHHKNDTDIEGALFYQNSNLPSACSLVVKLLKQWKLKISEIAATYLYGGMLTDTGRFMYINNTNASETLSLAAYITKYNPDIEYLHNFLYTEPLESKLIKNMFTDFELLSNNVAIQINKHEKVLASKLSPHTVARRMIGQMAGIKEIPIWASFTEDKENNLIKAEVRSREIPVVDVCKAFGGGGHLLACGASLNTWEEVEEMKERLNELVNNFENN